MIINSSCLNLNPDFSAVSNVGEAQKKTEELLRGLDKKSFNINQRIGQEAVKLPTLQEVRAAKKDFFEESFDVSKFQIVKTKRNYERDYNAYEALSNTWLASSQNSVLTWYESGSKVSDESVRDMSKADFLNYVRKNGLDKEINWEGIERHFRGIKTFDNFSEFTDYTAALFAGLENRIKNDFSGEEQKTQLDILEGLYEKAVKDFAEQFAHGSPDEEFEKGLDLSFTYFGTELPEGKIEASIRGVMDGKRAAYSDYIAKNKDYAGVENTEDSWLKREVGFMTCALKNAFKPADIQVKDGLWNEKDLLAIGMLGSMYSVFPAIDKACAKLQNMDEERLGLALSMCWLTTEKITVDLNVSESVKGLANGLFEKYAFSLLGDTEEALEGSRKNPLGTSSAAFKKLDKNSVYSILNVMKNTFKESGDYEKAIYKTASFAHDTAVKKLKRDEYLQLWRYNKPKENAIDAKRFWGSFYDGESKLSYGGGMGKLINKWNKVNGILKSMDLYAFKRNVGAGMFTSFSN